MDKRDLARWRLSSQRLSGTPLESAEAVVGWLVGVQSQDYRLAKWSLGQRARGVTDSDVDKLVADGTILRTHVLRPTWHFVLPADIRWMMALTGPRILRGSTRRFEDLGLDGRIVGRAMELISGALSGGRRLTRPQVGALLAGEGIEASGGRLAWILMKAELDLVVCSGGLDGTQQTYALLDERAPVGPTFVRDEALAELTRRYFTGHGPSAIADFTWWSGVTVADAKRGLSMVGSELEEIVVEGTTYWFGQPMPRHGARSAEVHLLQPFDEYVVGYQKTRSAIDVAGLSGPGTWNPNTFMNAIVIDGQVAGGWRRVVDKAGARIETRPFRPLNRPEEAALESAVKRYGGFLDLPVSLAVQP
jgi:hypothetical protein